jgi:hypothetical protein
MHMHHGPLQHPAFRITRLRRFDLALSIAGHRNVLVNTYIETDILEDHPRMSGDHICALQLLAAVPVVNLVEILSPLRSRHL